MLPNRVNASLTDAEVESILKDLQALEKKMVFLQSLTRGERQALPKMGDRSVAFVQKALEVGIQHTELMPRYFEPEDMQKDVGLYQQLTRIELAVSRLRQRIQDTMHVAGSEAYVASLSVYKSLQNLPSSAGLENVLSEMSKRFARSTQTEDKGTSLETNTDKSS